MIEFIIKSSIKYSIDESDFTKDLQQLGLPLESAEGFLKGVNKERAALSQALKESSLTLNLFEDLHYQISYVLDSDSLHPTHHPESLQTQSMQSQNVVNFHIQMDLHYHEGKKIFSVSEQMVGGLLSEMKKVQEYIQNFEM